MAAFFVFIAALLCLFWDIHDHRSILMDLIFIIGSSYFLIQDFKEHVALKHKYFKWNNKHEDSNTP